MQRTTLFPTLQLKPKELGLFCEPKENGQVVCLFSKVALSMPRGKLVLKARRISNVAQVVDWTLVPSVHPHISTNHSPHPQSKTNVKSQMPSPYPHTLLEHPSHCLCYAASFLDSKRGKTEWKRKFVGDILACHSPSHFLFYSISHFLLESREQEEDNLQGVGCCQWHS